MPEKLSPADASHVIDPSQLLIYKVAKTIDGYHYSSDTQTRCIDGDNRKGSRPELVAGMGESLIKLIENIPAGVLVFFSSANEMNAVRAIWETTITK